VVLVSRPDRPVQPPDGALARNDPKENRMTTPGPHDGGVPDLAEVQAILDRHGITMAAIEAQIDAEQAAIAEGTLVALTTHARRGRDACPGNR
jgi:hypothetical protein